MTQAVQMPDGTIHNFPDEATPQMMAQALGVKTLPESQMKAPLFDSGAVPRGLAKGAAGLTDFVLRDIPGYLTQAAGFLSGNDQIKQQGKDIRDIPLAGSVISNLLQKYDPNETKPKSGFTNFAEGASEIVGGNLMLGPLAIPKTALAAKGIVGSAIGSGLGGAISPEDPTLKAVLGIAGGLAPGGAALAGNAVRRGIVGSNPGNLVSNIDAFKSVGVTPSVGQATQTTMNQGIESALSKVPGSSGVMRRFAENQAQGISNKVDELASKLSKTSSAEQAGRAIEKGIKSDFLPKAREIQGQLYDKLDNYIQPEAPVSAQNTVSALLKLTSPIKGAENVSATKLLKNPVLESVKEGIISDIAAQRQKMKITSLRDTFSEELPYQALKEIRTRIGSLLENVDLAPDVPKAQLKQLYGALSEDMKGAAKLAGPDAQFAFGRANKFTKALHDRIDTVQTVLDRNGGPEKVFQAAIGGTGEGASTLRAVMKSLPKSGKDVLGATVLRRLGRATPGNQNDVGDVFSIDTFLTNWNKISPEAKSALYGGQSVQFREDLNKISKVVSNIKSGSKVFQNPSGTASSSANIAVLTALGGAVGTGNFPTAGKILAGLAVTNVAARAMTNPKFVRWLAANANKPSAQIPSLLTNLRNLGESKKDRDLIEISDALKTVK